MHVERLGLGGPTVLGPCHGQGIEAIELGQRCLTPAVEGLTLEDTQPGSPTSSSVGIVEQPAGARGQATLGTDEHDGTSVGLAGERRVGVAPTNPTSRGGDSKHAKGVRGVGPSLPRPPPPSRLPLAWPTSPPPSLPSPPPHTRLPRAGESPENRLHDVVRIEGSPQEGTRLGRPQGTGPPEIRPAWRPGDGPVQPAGACGCGSQSA